MITINVMTQQMRNNLCTRRWRERNPEKCKAHEYSHTYYKAHPERCSISTRAWQKAHPENIKAINHKRRACKLGNGGSYTADEWLILRRQYSNRCVACWKTETELKAVGRKLVPDHIFPLAKGGLNHICNLQPLCHGIDGCNNHKSDKVIDYVIS